MGVHFYHTVYHLLPSLCGPSFCQDWYEMFRKGYKISLKYCSMGKQCGWPIMCGCIIIYTESSGAKQNKDHMLSSPFPITVRLLITMIIQIIRLWKNEYSCQKQKYILILRIIPMLLYFLGFKTRTTVKTTYKHPKLF